MFYQLFIQLVEYNSIFNIFRYITFRAIAALITSLVFSFFIGPRIIKMLKKKKVTETISEHISDTHLEKQGTPTMGGLIMIASILVSTFLWNNLVNQYVILLLITLLWLGGVGFLDDYLKNFLNKKDGLSPKHKLIGQGVLALIIGSIIYFSPNSHELTRICLPFLKNAFLPLSFFFIPFVIFMIVGTSNAVNLTDGLDGLATGLITLSTFGLGIMAYIKGHYEISQYLNINFISGAGEVTIFASSMIGTTIGFLWFNSSPAEIIMGDTGSLSLGGLLALISILLQEQIFFAMIGGVFVVEALSSMLQTGYFKYTKKKLGQGVRFFKRAPLHHHYQLKGLTETKIVVRFWIIGILLLAIGLSTLKLR